MFRECHKSYSKFKTLFAWKWEGSVCESLIDTMEVNESLNESFEIVLWPEWSSGGGAVKAGSKHGTAVPAVLFGPGPPRHRGGWPVRALCRLLLKNVYVVFIDKDWISRIKHTCFTVSSSSENTVMHVEYKRNPIQ